MTEILTAALIGAGLLTVSLILIFLWELWK